MNINPLYLMTVFQGKFVLSAGWVRPCHITEAWTYSIIKTSKGGSKWRILVLSVKKKYAKA